MKVIWQINVKKKLVLVKFRRKAVAEDWAAHNRAMLNRPDLVDFAYLIDFSRTDCDQTVFIDLVGPIEDLVNRVKHWRQPKVAFLAVQPGQHQLVRFFSAFKDLLPGSEVVMCVHADQNTALHWLDQDR